jgi:hypothetical protein
MEKVSIVYYNDVTSVEDEIGNKVIVSHNMFNRDVKENAMIFGLGLLVKEEMSPYNYSRSKPVEWQEEIKDENYMK